MEGEREIFHSASEILKVSWNSWVERCQVKLLSSILVLIFPALKCIHFSRAKCFLKLGWVHWYALIKFWLILGVSAHGLCHNEFQPQLKTIFWLIPKSSSSTGVPKSQTPVFRIWPCEWLAGACTTQLAQAAAQRALTCVHNSPLLVQVELRTCAPACHSHKGCVCASLPLAQPCSLSLPPSWANKMKRLETADLI